MKKRFAKILQCLICKIAACVCLDGWIGKDEEVDERVVISMRLRMRLP